MYKIRIEESFDSAHFLAGYYVLYHFIPESIAALIGFCLVLVVRYLAKRFEWNLPR